MNNKVLVVESKNCKILHKKKYKNICLRDMTIKDMKDLIEMHLRNKLKNQLKKLLKK